MAMFHKTAAESGQPGLSAASQGRNRLRKFRPHPSRPRAPLPLMSAARGRPRRDRRGRDFVEFAALVGVLRLFSDPVCPLAERPAARDFSIKQGKNPGNTRRISRFFHPPHGGKGPARRRSAVAHTGSAHQPSLRSGSRAAERRSCPR